MANLDAFTAQIVEMVRNMSDEAILSSCEGSSGRWVEGSPSRPRAAAPVAPAAPHPHPHPPPPPHAAAPAPLRRVGAAAAATR